MKLLVAYMSISGNTKKIAEAIFEELPDTKEIKPLNEIENLDDYDFSFIGFPVHQFGAPKQIKEFFEQHTIGKNVALFVTHATGLHMKNILEPQLIRCKELAKNANLKGFYNCQGALSEQVAERMLNHEDPQLRKFAEMRKFTLGRPNEEEIMNARKFAKEIISDF